jgi:hypothetical protein
MKTQMINVNDTFRAYICLRNYDTTHLPEYFITYTKDTFSLEMDSSYCGIFKSIHQKIGKKQCQGFVDYFDNKGEKKHENFTIKYEVK